MSEAKTTITMREVCFILVEDKILRVYFGSTTRIPDNRGRWEIIWQHRNEITRLPIRTRAVAGFLLLKTSPRWKPLRLEREGVYLVDHHENGFLSRKGTDIGAMIRRGGWN